MNIVADAAAVGIARKVSNKDRCNVDPSETQAKNDGKRKVANTSPFVLKKGIVLVGGMTSLLQVLLVIALCPSWRRVHHHSGSEVEMQYRRLNPVPLDSTLDYEVEEVWE